MYNFTLQRRPIETMSMMALLAAGGSPQEALATTANYSPFAVITTAVDSSHGRAVLNAYQSPIKRFQQSVSDFYSDLAQRQVTLDPDMAAALNVVAWDLYESE